MIPADWKEVRLGDHASMRSGGTPLTSVASFYGGTIPWASISDMSASGKYLGATDRYITEAGLSSSPAVVFPEGVLLYAMYASIGECCISVCPMATSQAILGIKCANDLSLEFLYYTMQSKRAEIARSGQQGTQANLNAQMVRETMFSLPPLKEQEAIAEVLSNADALVESLDALIAKKRDMKQAAMQQLLTGRTRLPGFNAEWDKVRLGEHAAFYKGNGLSKSQLIDDGPQQCVHYGELFTQYGPVIETVTSKCVAFEGSFKSLAGDVLMPGSDVTPRGLATASAIKVSDVVLGGDVIVIRTKPTSLHGPFLSNFIRMSKGRVLRLVKGSTVYHIHAKDLADLEVLMPPLKEQEAIAEVLSDMDAEIDALVAQREKAELVKQGMMQELLSGRVRLV